MSDGAGRPPRPTPALRIGDIGQEKGSGSRSRPSSARREGRTPRSARTPRTGESVPEEVVKSPSRGNPRVRSARGARAADEVAETVKSPTMRRKSALLSPNMLSQQFAPKRTPRSKVTGEDPHSRRKHAGADTDESVGAGGDYDPSDPLGFNKKSKDAEEDAYDPSDPLGFNKKGKAIAEEITGEDYDPSDPLGFKKKAAAQADEDEGEDEGYDPSDPLGFKKKAAAEEDEDEGYDPSDPLGFKKKAVAEDTEDDTDYDASDPLGFNKAPKHAFGEETQTGAMDIPRARSPVYDDFVDYGDDDDGAADQAPNYASAADPLGFCSAGNSPSRSAINPYKMSEDELEKHQRKQLERAKALGLLEEGVRGAISMPSSPVRQKYTPSSVPSSPAKGRASALFVDYDDEEEDEESAPVKSKARPKSAQYTDKFDPLGLLAQAESEGKKPTVNIYGLSEKELQHHQNKQVRRALAKGYDVPSQYVSPPESGSILAAGADSPDREQRSRGRPKRRPLVKTKSTKGTTSDKRAAQAAGRNHLHGRRKSMSSSPPRTRVIEHMARLAEEEGC